MFHSNDVRWDRGRLATSLKAAALVAVIAVLAVLIEQQPLRFAGVSHAMATGDSPVAARKAEPAEAQLPAAASEYFPSRFGPTSGEIEVQPPTF